MPPAETLQGATCATVPHDMPFVAQLIAQGRDVPTPRRRKSDRAGPLRAYAALETAARGTTRRIV